MSWGQGVAIAPSAHPSSRRGDAIAATLGLSHGVGRCALTSSVELWGDAA
jgi:hypothetical protein